MNPIKTLVKNWIARAESDLKPTVDETEEAIEIAEKVKSSVLKKLKEGGFNNG